MTFTYHWSDNEANFGPPVPNQTKGGTHISFEIILKYKNNFVALRRPNAIPGHELPEKAKEYSNGLLYFCHGLIRYGEPVEECVKRIVKDQAGVEVTTYKVIDIWSEVQTKDDQWAFTPSVIAEIETLPQQKQGADSITEVVKFITDTIPTDFGWWESQELKDFLS